MNPPERSHPPVTEPGGASLRQIYATGPAAITAGIESVFEQAVIYCLFVCRNQFYFDGNKRTSRAMMNGHLLAHGSTRSACRPPGGWSTTQR